MGSFPEDTASAAHAPVSYDYKNEFHGLAVPYVARDIMGGGRGRQAGLAEKMSFEHGFLEFCFSELAGKIYVFALLRHGTAYRVKRGRCGAVSKSRAVRHQT